MEYFNSILGIFRLDFRISEWISGFQIGFLDSRVDFWISEWISIGFLDFNWISGFQSGFLDFRVDFNWISIGFLDFRLDFCRQCTRFLSWRTPRVSHEVGNQQAGLCMYIYILKSTFKYTLFVCVPCCFADSGD